jgi:hypothetical protein
MARDWEGAAVGAIGRHDDGAERLPEAGDERQRQLTRMGNAAWAAGVSYLMADRSEEAREWLLRAAERYRESWAGAPPGSWGRPIGAMKARLIADDLAGAREDARWALDAGAAESQSPIGVYAAVLAWLVLDEDDEAVTFAESLRDRVDFPRAVGAALLALVGANRAAYETAIAELLVDFEAREEFLEDAPVADTVLALQRLAARRGFAPELSSERLPRPRP